MEVFNLTLSQMLMMFTLMALGYTLRKLKILPENSDTVMSRLETYIFCPALTLGNLISNCTVETFANNSRLILYGGVIISVAVLLAYPLSALFVRNYKTDSGAAYTRNVYKYAMAFANWGFMGNYIILGIFGDTMYFKYSMFTFIVNIVGTCWGLYVLVPKDKNASLAKNMASGFLKPPMLAVFAGIILGLLGTKAYMPDFLTNGLTSAGNCMGPVAMLLAGFVIGGFNFKEMVTNKKIYLASFMRLILIPSVFLGILKLLGTPEEIMIFTLVCFATPLGLNTVVFPAAYGGDTKPGASMAMISHTLCVVTIPLMYLFWIVLL